MLSLVDYGDSDSDNDTKSSPSLQYEKTKDDPEQDAKSKEIIEHNTSATTFNEVGETKVEQKAPGGLFGNLSAPKNDRLTVAEQQSRKDSKKRKRHHKDEKISFQVPIDVKELKKTEEVDNTPSLALHNQPKNGIQHKSILDFLPPVQHQTEGKRKKVKLSTTTTGQQFSFEKALKNDIAKPILFEPYAFPPFLLSSFSSFFIYFKDEHVHSPFASSF